jgi:hypothetical protein
MGSATSKAEKNVNRIFKGVIQDNKSIVITKDHVNVSCDIKEITKEDFQDLTHIEELVLQGTGIMNVKDQAFYELKNLRILYFYFFFSFLAG